MLALQDHAHGNVGQVRKEATNGMGADQLRISPDRKLRHELLAGAFDQLVGHRGAVGQEAWCDKGNVEKPHRGEHQPGHREIEETEWSKPEIGELARDQQIGRGAD